MAGAFNEQDLRNTALWLSDPTDQPKLLTRIPDGAGLVDIINLYTFERYPKEKAFCVVCQSRRHKKGFTALLTTGHRVLLGSHCGAKKFGSSWEDAEKRLRIRSDQRFELMKYDRLTMIRDPLEKKLPDWLRTFTALEGRKAAFYRIFGELASRLEVAASRGDARLTVYREVKVSAFSQAGGRNLGSSHEEVTVGTLAGSLFFDRMNTQHAVINAIKCVEEHNFQNAQLVEMTKRRRALERAFKELELCEKIYHDANAFLSPASFQALAHWSTLDANIRHKLKAKANGLFYADNPDKGITLLPLPDLDESLNNELWEYRRAS